MRRSSRKATTPISKEKARAALIDNDKLHRHFLAMSGRSPLKDRDAARDVLEYLLGCWMQGDTRKVSEQVANLYGDGKAAGRKILKGDPKTRPPRSLVDIIAADQAQNPSTEGVLIKFIPVGQDVKLDVDGVDRPPRQDSDPQRAEMPDFEEIGTASEALRVITARIKNRPVMIKDTAVRWTASEKSLYEADELAAFGNALRAYTGKFQSVTSPVLDEPYMKTLAKAFAAKPEKLSAYRLHRPAAIMNFIILEYDDAPAEVYFGYGAMDSSVPRAEKVFRSENVAIVNQFTDLFDALKAAFSATIRPEAKQFVRSVEDYACDIVQTWDTFPKDAIIASINDLRDTAVGQGSRDIFVSVTAWPLFVTDQDLRDAVENALLAGCNVSLAIWDQSSDFVRLRGFVVDGDETSVRDEVTKTERALDKLKHQLAANVETAGKLTLTHSQSILGSVPIFRIGDQTYFGGYWVGNNASAGPHFLARSGSALEKFLFDDDRGHKGQYQKMQSRVRSSVVAVTPPQISVHARWGIDEFHDLVGRCQRGTELRIQTSHLLSETILKVYGGAVTKGVKLKVLLMHRNAYGLLKARFRLRGDRTLAIARSNVIAHVKKVRARGGEIKETDVMPFGFFAQGVELCEDGSTSAWMRVAPMTGIDSYQSSPWIELRKPLEAQGEGAWRVFEDTWNKTWDSPLTDPNDLEWMPDPNWEHEEP